MKYAQAALWIFYGWAFRKLHMPARWVHAVEDQASMRMSACAQDFAPVPWSDFYEDDEPLDKVKALFENGDKVSTARPRSPVGWRCEHFSMTTGGVVSLPVPPTTSLCGCVLQPVFA